jgi:alkanesulfonate monooxygenase SsuD/methylene tetrahydromethanopterin reductase-like flavin-dependent oxidoreductase (luciferase family)
MQYGLFMMPMHLPEKSPAQAFAEDIDLLLRADALGYSEAWIGEHFTSAWENIPAPDLLIARTVPHIHQMILGTGVVLLQYQHPVLVANRLAYLDYLTNGRLYCGFGSGGLPTDSKLFGVPMDGRARFMTRESVEIILRLWTEEPPFKYHGDYWHITAVSPDPKSALGIYLKPLQKPHPPIAVAGTNVDSGTLQIAGERGWIPMSINFVTPRVLRSHWDSIAAGAARTGRTPDRLEWRVCRAVHVAETDEQARREALDGVLGRDYGDYFLPLLSLTRGLNGLKLEESMPDSAITLDYLCNHVWLVGSPETVARKIRQLYAEVDGFGGLLIGATDWPDAGVWDRSMRLFATEVAPRVADLGTPAALTARR